MTFTELQAMKPGQRFRRPGAHTTAAPRYYTLLGQVTGQSGYAYLEAMERGQTKREIVRVHLHAAEEYHLGWEN